MTAVSILCHCEICNQQTERNQLGACKVCIKINNKSYHAAHKQERIDTRLAYKEKYSTCSEQRFCPKCNALTERHRNGTCKPCAKAYSKLYYVTYVKSLNISLTDIKKDAVKQYKADYRKLNAVAIEEYRTAWHVKNPDARRLHGQNRRSRLRNSVGMLSIGLGERLFKLQKGKCPCCGLPLGNDYHLDHINPLSLGGSNEDSNIQLLRPICNSKKHAKHPIDFMQSKGFLL